MQQTVFAPATPYGGAVAIVRISGPMSRDILRRITGRELEASRLSFVRIRDKGELIDEAMAVRFQAPHSYTGEDMAELHIHGGRETMKRVLSLLSSLGAAPAEGGEFTKRAFMNGKMDLTEAEAVMDVVNAEASGQLRAALEQLGGGMRRRVERIEEPLLSALSGLDAAIDYPDEADESAYASLHDSLTEALRLTDELIRQGRHGRIVRDGAKAVILGRPNAGKSSLMNALLMSDRAIVTATAGTTRDLIEEKLSLCGMVVRLVDTAGIREAFGEAERMGIDRALAAASACELCLWVTDVSQPYVEPPKGMECPVLVVANKCDLEPNPETARKLRALDSVSISVKTGEGLDELKKRMVELMDPDPQGEAVTNERHLTALERARADIAQALDGADDDFVATDINEALHELGSVTGRDVDAEVIDRIFSNFCVGK